MIESSRPGTSRGATYFVDSVSGRDSASGTSAHAAWKSLARLKNVTLNPGDRVMLAGGSVFPGALTLGRSWRGSTADPIVITSDPRSQARIEGDAGDGIALNGCEYVRIENLRVVGAGRKAESSGAGIRLEHTRGVEIRNVDVSGFRLGGINAAGDLDTRILHVRARDNGSAGIEVYSGRNGFPRTRNLYIAHCLVENNPGDPQNRDNHSGNGIVVGGADGAVIEYCVATNNGWDMPREGNGPVGIWGWNCDRLVIQSCISYRNRSPGLDGGGFDFDGGVTNSLMQYNLSFENAGCGILLCQYPGARPWKNNIIRYNISYGDGAKNFQSGIGLWLGDEGISDALIHNNTIVNSGHAVNSLGSLPRFTYRNNVFVSDRELLTGAFDQSRFENNLYWSRSGAPLLKDGGRVFKSLREWAEATAQEARGGAVIGKWADPMISLPTIASALPTEVALLERMKEFRLSEGSPCAGAGMTSRDRGHRDFFGNALRSGNPSIGAHEPH